MVKVVEKTQFFLPSLCDITKTADTSVIPETQKILKTFFSEHVEGLFFRSGKRQQEAVNRGLTRRFLSFFGISQELEVDPFQSELKHKDLKVSVCSHC